MCAEECVCSEVCVQWSGDLSQWLLGGIISNIISIFNSSMLAAGGVKARIRHNSEGLLSVSVE